MPKRGKNEETIEYINTTKSVPVWVDVSTDYEDKPEPKLVKPGKSVHFTKDDLLRNKRTSSSFFSKGLLRPATATKSQLTDVDVKDDMSTDEMESFVKNTTEIKNFGTRLRKLLSINTLENILEITKKSNKTYNFIETVERRMEKINAKEDEE